MNRSKSEIKNITVFGRFNREVPVYTNFEAQPFTKLHNPHRGQAQNVGDAIIDPAQTISHNRDFTLKDPGYGDIVKRNTRTHDFRSKVINDNQNRVMIKVDEKYGLQNGGLYGQSTFNHSRNSVGGSMRPSEQSRATSDLGNAGREILSPSSKLRDI